MFKSGTTTPSMHLVKKTSSQILKSCKQQTSASHFKTVAPSGGREKNSAHSGKNTNTDSVDAVDAADGADGADGADDKTCCNGSAVCLSSVKSTWWRTC